MRRCDRDSLLKGDHLPLWIPHSIITDNGTNFAVGEMAEFCRTQGIRLDVASVAHPESNGQAERANQSVLAGLKPRLQVPLERSPG